MTAPKSKHHVRILPATRTGWGSLACGGLSLVAWFMVQRAPDVGPWLPLAYGSFWGFAILGAIAGAIDLVRSREWALAVVLPILYGLALAGLLAVTLSEH